MSRFFRAVSVVSALVAMAALIAACGTERISVPKQDAGYRGAVLFAQRCSGCHSLAYAGTHGSASNIRTALITNGPNFNIRCERPVTRVLYAIENGGFSGAIMPQNIVVGQDARAVAQFVAEYAGRQAPKVTGQTICQSQPIGSIPLPGQSAASAGGTGSPTAGQAPNLPLSQNGHGSKPKTGRGKATNGSPGVKSSR